MITSDLIGDVARVVQAGQGAVITGLTADSRAVKQGNLFAALPGSKTDGLSFVPRRSWSAPVRSRRCRRM